MMFSATNTTVITEAQNNGLWISGTESSRGITVALDTSDMTAWRTEIGWPIFQTG